MPDEPPFPEITPLELAEWMRLKADLVLLDVREADETAYAPLPDARVVHAPLSLLARLGTRALPARVTPEAEVVVLCHLGMRSAQVTRWLREDMEFPHVYNLRGGIVAYALQVDPAVRRY